MKNNKGNNLMKNSYYIQTRYGHVKGFGSDLKTNGSGDVATFENLDDALNAVESLNLNFTDDAVEIIKATVGENFECECVILDHKRLIKFGYRFSR